MSTFRYRSCHGSSRQIPHTRIENESEIVCQYTFGSLLGNGSFGTVTEATRIADGTLFAIKVINKEKAGTSAVKLLEREVVIMKKVDHPNIIHLEEVLETNIKMYLVMELCALGDLEEYLVSKGCLPEKEVLCIMQQLVNAVAYIHENDIIHRDLKLENILLAQSNNDLIFNIKLTDFGLSYTRGGSGSDYMMNQAVGTPIYMAPEVITNYGYSQQCDIWSIGVILYKLISGDAPFMADTEEELFELIKKGDIKFESEVWSSVSQAAKQLIEGMLKVDPAHRLTSKEILYHPWIKGEQDVNGNMTTNVLEMMKQYNLEQKQLAGKKREVEASSNMDDGENGSEAPDDTIRENELETSKSSIPDNTRRTPSLNSLTSLSASGGGNTPSSASGSTRSIDKKMAFKSNSLPSYMQHTKSSKVPKNSNTKSSSRKK